MLTGYNWSQVLDNLQRSLFAEQMVCSMSTQLFHIPRTQDLEGNPEMHQHLVPASYHRVTAIGSAQRLQHGEYHESIIKTLSSCIQNAKMEDRGVMEWLYVMKEAADSDVKPYIETIIYWQELTQYKLALAEHALNQIGIYVENAGLSPTPYVRS
ncbi:hypothetical protein [Caldalkalibacillus uzonensis]|nr:hypothetical protein [Caldalkalibacillus uzonensis]